MIQFLAFILIGAKLHGVLASGQEEENYDVKYNGPVVYTNLPPPVLYFPSFPEKPKFSNRGSDGDTEDKRIEYVPFPYKDLPLLVYQSESQPPVHVVEKNSGNDESSSAQLTSGYQTGPAVYKVADNEQYGSDEVDSDHNNQDAITSTNEKFINVGLSTSPVTSIGGQNQQFISIGVTSIQPHENELYGQSNNVNTGSSHIQHANNILNQLQYSQNQNNNQLQYSSNQNSNPSQYSSNQNNNQLQYSSNQNSNPSQYSSNQNSNPSQYSTNQNSNSLQYPTNQNSNHANYPPQVQNTPAYVYYPGQYPNQNVATQAQVPVEQLTNAIQSYLIQQNNLQQQSQTGNHQSHVSQAGNQHSTQPSSDGTPLQHVGITIIQQPSVADTQEYGTNAQNNPTPAPQPPSPPQKPIQNNDNYDDNQQRYVSIGVYPVNVPGNDYNQNTQQYYNLIPPTSNEQYQNTNEDLKQSNQNENQPLLGHTENAPPAGYQVISIDLSTLKNQHLEQERNVAPDYPEKVKRPPNNAPPQNYRPLNEKENSYNGKENEYQQILIQIPHTILSDQSENSHTGSGSYETPYTGTAQVSKTLRGSDKTSNHPMGNNRQPHNRYPQRPPPNMHHSERPKNQNRGLGFQQKGVISNGINIAIIKQTDSSHPAPVFRPADNRPPFHNPYKAPSRPTMNRVPNKHFGQVFGHSHQHFPLEDHNFNRARDPAVSGSHHYTFTADSHNYDKNFGQYRNKHVLPYNDGPGFYSSSTHQYMSVNPTVRKPPRHRNPFAVHQPAAFTQESATKNHAQFVPSPSSYSSVGSETVIHDFGNNIPNPFSGVDFDDINSFLSPNYDLFGSLTKAPNKKKVEDETKFLQTVTSDLLTHNLNTPNLAPTVPPPVVPPPVVIPPAVPPYRVPKPIPTVPRVPFPYKYWEQPIVNIGPPGMMYGDRARLMQYYSHMQHPYVAGNRPFPSLNKDNGRKRGLSQGRLRRKLAALRTSFRHKSKIAPRQETTNESSENPSEQIDAMYEIAAPRSTIIQVDGPGLDGVTIPLNSEHIISSRSSLEHEDSEKEAALPPIIVYKGSKPPVEIYGRKSDIEGTSEGNETQKHNKDDKKVTEENNMDKQDSKMSSSKTDTVKESDDLTAQESIKSYSLQGRGYFDYMYSVLPDLFKDSLNRRQDSDNSKWLPVNPIEYSLTGDNFGNSNVKEEKGFIPFNPAASKDSTTTKNSSDNIRSTIEESIEELISLLGKEEKSDLLQS